MNEIIAYLKKSLNGKGNISMVRITTFLVVANVMAVWTYNCVMNRKIEDIPVGVVSVIGLLIAASVAQKFAETPGSSQ